MDRTTRWETEAIRGVGAKRQTPPKPTRKRTRTDFTDNRNWVTLREAEEATGIPVNTLRKWVRKADLPSYLEADGDLALRMIDLDAVVSRAKELGRQIPEARVQKPESGSEPDASDLESGSEPEASDLASNTMIVPVDAWNKMLNQLGNLHEAGQQLAEARERAAKAETEAKFLREQLGRKRTENKEQRTKTEPESNVPDAKTEPEPIALTVEPETTSYWRYLTTGWRDRNRRR